jgi:cytidylate kinase
MHAEIPVIAVDGPSGTGKGTLCSHLAHWLHWHFLDSGALYRVLALVTERQQLEIDNESEIRSLASGLEVIFKNPDARDEVRVFLAGDDVSLSIRTESCGSRASQLATLPGVRKALLARQRAFRNFPGLIADVRDMGTIVFPDAKLKLFLTATPGVRGQRRHKQLKEKGFDVNLAQLSADIAERDTRDSERTISPLKPADDAVVIDTTNLSIEVVTQRVVTLVQERVPDLL